MIDAIRMKKNKLQILQQYAVGSLDLLWIGEGEVTPIVWDYAQLQALLPKLNPASARVLIHEMVAANWLQRVQGAGGVGFRLTMAGFGTLQQLLGGVLSATGEEVLCVLLRRRQPGLKVPGKLSKALREAGLVPWLNQVWVGKGASFRGSWREEASSLGWDLTAWKLGSSQWLTPEPPWQLDRPGSTDLEAISKEVSDLLEQVRSQKKIMRKHFTQFGTVCARLFVLVGAMRVLQVGERDERQWLEQVSRHMREIAVIISQNRA